MIGYGRRCLVAFLFCSLAACFGCDTGRPDAVTFEYEKAHVAAVIALVVNDEAAPMPTPTPTPTPDGKCDNCGGSGKIGDGRVFVDCPVCGGDGVASKMFKDIDQNFWVARPSVQVVNVSQQEPVKEPPQEETRRSFGDKPEFNPDLVMYTKDWCMPCRRWKTTELDKILKLGKRVLIMEAPDGLTIPHFVIIGESDKRLDHSGFLSVEEYRIKSAGL